MFPGSLPSGQMLHWAGKTKGQGQAGELRHAGRAERLQYWNHDAMTSSPSPPPPRPPSSSSSSPSLPPSLPPPGSADLSVGRLVGSTEQHCFCCGCPAGQMLNTCQLSFFIYLFFFFKCKIIQSLAPSLTTLHTHKHTQTHTNTHTHLRVPGLGLSPEQLECAGVLSLDPPGWHHQVSIRLCYHHQVGPLNDAPLDALDRDFAIKEGGRVINFSKQINLMSRHLIC